MIELRYNGCTHCLSSVKASLRSIGLFAGRDYVVSFHDEHRNDELYQLRPDYLTNATGAILYNPATKHWLDLYDKNTLSRVLRTDTRAGMDKLSKLYHSLAKGS